MYTVNGKEFSSYFAAIAEAKVHRADVIETATGNRRWTPPAQVSAKKMRRYEQQKAAYEAQQSMKSIYG